MQDQPDASALIQAVALFLEQELTPSISDPRLRFRSLIAANVLAIVGRELASGDEPIREEWRRLTALLGTAGEPAPTSTDELYAAVQSLTRDLCARIRAGGADELPWFDAVLDHARATVVEKLMIANPRYLERIAQ